MFHGQPLAVVGGGDSACEEANRLTRFGSAIYLVHRRNRLRASRIMVDRTTGSVPATVFLEVTPVQDRDAAHLSIQAPSGEPVQLQLETEPWKSCRIEASDDLVHWVPLTNVLSTDLVLLVLDSDSTNLPQRFYRAARVRVAPAIDPIPDPSPTGFGFMVGGAAGRICRVQASTNLLDCATLAHVVLTNSKASFTDPSAAQFNQRFYRIVGP